jgi:hypothetical protein
MKNQSAEWIRIKCIGLIVGTLLALLANLIWISSGFGQTNSIRKAKTHNDIGMER